MTGKLLNNKISGICSGSINFIFPKLELNKIEIPELTENYGIISGITSNIWKLCTDLVDVNIAYESYNKNYSSLDFKYVKPLLATVQNKYKIRYHTI